MKSAKKFAETIVNCSIVGVMAVSGLTACMSAAGLTQKINVQTIQIRNELEHLREENRNLEVKIASARGEGNTTKARELQSQQIKVQQEIARLEEKGIILSY
jgi:hypothetical protein